MLTARLLSPFSPRGLDGHKCPTVVCFSQLRYWISRDSSGQLLAAGIHVDHASRLPTHVHGTVEPRCCRRLPN
jgi:hypothetical protein